MDDKLDADRPTKPECIGREHPGIARKRPDKPVKLGKRDMNTDETEWKIKWWNTYPIKEASASTVKCTALAQTAPLRLAGRRPPV